MRLVTAEVLNGTVFQPSHNQTRLGRLQFAAGDLEAEQERLYMEEEVEHSATTNAGLVAVLGNNITTRASNEGYPKVPDDFTITEKAPTRRFQPGEGPSRGLLRDCENFADGSFTALSESRLT